MFNESFFFHVSKTNDYYAFRDVSLFHRNPSSTLPFSLPSVLFCPLCLFNVLLMCCVTNFFVCRCVTMYSFLKQNNVSISTGIIVHVSVDCTTFIDKISKHTT